MPGLPNIFPDLGPATIAVLFADLLAPRAEPTHQQWREEYQIILEQGLAGIALRRARDLELAIPSDVMDALQRRHFEGMALTATVVRESQQGLDVLRSAGIPFAVTKGPGIALIGTSKSERPFIDIDVVVSPSTFRAAQSVLADIGYRERDQSRLPWDSFDRFCREAVNLRHSAGGSIDLHHRIAPWFWSEGLNFDMLSRSVSSVILFGVDLPVVSTEMNLLVSSLHIVSDKNHPGQTLRAWRDVVLLARHSSVKVVLEAAERAGLTAWLTWMLTCIPAEVRPEDLWNGLRHQNRRVKGSARLRMLLPPRFGAEHVLGQVFRLPAPNGALFVLGMAIPSPAFLRTRFPGHSHPYLAWWRRSLLNLKNSSD